MCRHVSRNQPRLAKHVVVQEKQQVSARGACSGVARAGQSLVSLLHDLEAARGLQSAQSIGGPIAGAVDDHDDLVIRTRKVLCKQRLDCALHNLTPVECGNNDRDHHTLISRPPIHLRCAAH